MAKIVRLTESDLVRLVKKVIKEQAVSGGASGGGVWNMLKKAIEGLTTDEDGIQRACGMVTSPQIYQQLLALAKKEGYNTVMEYIMTDFGFGNGPVRTERSIGVNYDEWGTHPEVGGLWSKDEDTQTPLFCAAVFKKFNPKEYESFNKGVRVDKAV
jgi:hypothetical protein